MALSGDARVSAATASRIREIAQRLGYQRDPLLSALSSRGGRNSRGRAGANLAVVANWASRDFQFTNLSSRQMFDAAKEHAALFGYTLDYFWLKEARDAAHATRILRNRGVVGLIMEYLPGERQGHFSLGWEHFASVVLGHTLYRPEMHRVVPAYLESTRGILRRLKKQGYRRPGLILPSSHDLYSLGEYRAAYYLHWADESETPRKEMVPPFVFSGILNQYKLELRKWLKKLNPDVVLTVHAKESHNVLSNILGSTGGVPKVIGLDEPNLLGFSGTQLTGALFGRTAVDLLDVMVRRHERGVPEEPRTTLIRSQWMDGVR